MYKRYLVYIIFALGVIIMAIYSKDGLLLNDAYDIVGNSLDFAYDINGNVIYSKTPLPDLPIPSGDLIATSVVPLPDVHESGKGFTCTGLAYDASTDTFLVGDIVAMQPGETTAGNIVRLSNDFTEVIENIPTEADGPQGVTVDTKRNCMWVVSAPLNRIYQVSFSGATLSSFASPRPTGVFYCKNDDTLWVLTYANKMLHCTINGTIIESYDFAYQETLDQCFIDEKRGYMYITAETNYTGRNNVYLFDINTHEQSIACTVDSYSVEGIWIGADGRMVIMNDGYYHSATVRVNQANIYTLTSISN